MERAERRHVRLASRRRRRGGRRRAPVAVQRVARSCRDVATGAAKVAGDTAAAARGVGAAAVSGDRPYIVGLIALFALGLVMLSGPLQTYMDGRARVEVLEGQLGALESANRQLDARAGELRDPDLVELLARERLGMIRPGEVPYVVVPPEVERPQIASEPEAAAGTERSWLARVWAGLADLFG